MEMSPKYAAETASELAQHGYTCEQSEEERRDGDVLRFKATRYALTAPRQRLIMEVVSYPDGDTRYFLEIAEYHGLSSFSLELDSWKYRDDYIEFRYYTNPETGSALTLKISYPSVSSAVATN
jgi:hypothetical protein